jgi:IS30 family transposase
MLVKIPRRRTSELVTAAPAAKIQTPPAALKRALTWDHGKEMADHAKFTVDTGVTVYFCDPRSPWQRGSNEHQRAVAPVLPQRQERGPLHPGRPRRRRRPAQ